MTWVTGWNELKKYAPFFFHSTLGCRDSTGVSVTDNVLVVSRRSIRPKLTVSARATFARRLAWKPKRKYPHFRWTDCRGDATARHYLTPAEKKTAALASHCQPWRVEKRKQRRRTGPYRRRRTGRPRSLTNSTPENKTRPINPNKRVESTKKSKPVPALIGV